MHFGACSNQSPPPSSHLSTEASQHSEEEDQCPSSASSGKKDRALYSNLCYIYSVIYKANRFCKRVFRFICFDPLPGRRFWQLLSHTEERMIHSSGVDVILHKVARLLGVTLKMFGP